MSEEEKKKVPLRYFSELEKFIDKEVIVETLNGENTIETRGILFGIDFKYLNLILKTDTEKIFIRNYFKIRRMRGSK